MHVVCVCVRARVRACVRACMHACVRVCMCCSVGALEVWDRAVELFYQIKGGTVDYGAAHSKEHGACLLACVLAYLAAANLCL